MANCQFSIFNSRCLAVWMVAFQVSCFGAARELSNHFQDKPDPGSGGGISVKVSPIEGLEDALVIEATEYKVYAANVDRQAGTVSLRGLPPGRYDVILKYVAKIYEGVTLEESGNFVKLSKADLDSLEGVIWVSEDYFNKKQIGRLGGNGKIMKLVVEEIRDKRTFMPDGTEMKDTMIRRLDLWEMRKTGQVWQTKNCRNLFREERPTPYGKGAYCQFYYVEALGGARVGDSVVTLPPFDAAAAKTSLAPHFYRATHQEKQKK